jgi:predicted ATPase/class 3 adenylate cyclase
VAELPSGTVTFLFTDLVGSTRLWEEFPDAMRLALAGHDEVLRSAIAAHGGHVVKTTGDGFHAVFAHARDALGAAADGQVAVQAQSWYPLDALQVRMGLHTCEVEVRDGDYYGSAVNRAARLMGTAHGGQVVTSTVTAELAREAGFELRDLGEHRLAGLSRPERVWQLSADGLADEFPPLRSVDSLPGNLPRQVTSFVGRDGELDSLMAVVRARTLVTLTGVGGVGKTRLALETAAAMVGEFDDGAWLCELAPVTDPAAVWDTLAAAFRVMPAPGRGVDDVVLDYLAGKHMLLVLDNCEHLLDAAAEVVQAVEQRCRRVTVLATSREGLAVPGEQIVAVPSLGVPGPDADAEQLGLTESVRLFCDRARSVKSEFEPTGHVLGSVGVLCRRLDGIPLAIELAAARAASLAPDDLVARLDQRFKLLARGSRASLERHQTLRNTIDWSYDLLDHTERAALQGLSVFAGGADLVAAEAVLASDELDLFDVVDVVTQLVDKSLVVAASDDDGHVRYRMLESIRQYAQERLEDDGDAAAVRARHAAHYVALAESAAPRLRGREQIDAARQMARETDNFRVVIDWAVETGDPDAALRVVAALAVSGLIIGFSALEWAETAIEIPGAAECLRYPEVAAWAMWSATNRMDFQRADAVGAVVAEVLDERGTDDPAVARAEAALAFFRADVDVAARRATEWVALAESAGDQFEVANALVMLAAVQLNQSGPDAARTTFEEAVRIARDVGVASTLAIGLSTLAIVMPIEEADRSLVILDEAIDVSTRLGDRTALNAAMGTKGNIAAYRGDFAAALDAVVDVAQRLLDSGELINVGWALLSAAIALTHLGFAEPAAVLSGTGWAIVVPGPDDWMLRMAREIDGPLKAVLGDVAFEAFRARGANLAPLDALAYLISAAEIAGGTARP